MERELWRKRLGLPAMYAVLLVLVATFFLSFFNRFAGLRSGDGEYTAGVAFLSGLMPYRDYFTTAPPLNLLKSALLLKVFGTALIVSRAAGVVERLLIAAVLFRWLRQIFRPVPSLIASVVTLVVSAGDRTDPIASYNHDAIFCAMLSGIAASFVLSEDRRSWRSWRWCGLALLAGVFSALSILTKQTVGLGSACTVLVVVSLLLLKTGGIRDAVVWAGAFLGGCMLPLAAVAITLSRLGLLHASLLMLFVQGPAAKGAHVSDFLFRELRVGWDNFGWLTLGSFALALGWRAISRSTERSGDSLAAVNHDFRFGGELRRAGYVLMAGLATLGVAEMLQGLPALHDFSKSSVYFTFIGLTALLLGYAARIFSKEVSGRQSQCILFAAVSWSVAFTLSLSWPAFEAMVLPGLGFLLAAALEGTRRRALPFVYAALCFVALMQAREKLDLPFGFDYQEEPAVRWANSISDQSQMRGMRLPEQTVRFLDETVATIQRRTRADDRIFVYPEMGVLYALSSRRYPTWSGSHNIDVLSDSFAALEAKRLLAARPAIVVYYRLSEQQQRDAERLWREGRPSGQRVLVSAIEELVSGYRLSGSYRLSAGDPEILVYVRP